MFVYTLLLDKGKYYVGKTNNPILRLNDHFGAGASAWTKKYKPLEILELIPDCDKFDEDKYVMLYMNLYGIDNVRGGTYSTIELTEETVSFIKKSLNSANDKCFTCGQHGHFAKDCIPKRSNYTDMSAGTNISRSDEKNTILNYCTSNLTHIGKKCCIVCLQCGRDHPTENCYARTHIDGTLLVYVCYMCNKEFSDEKECVKHEKKCCITCRRCDRDHLTKDCYARTHKKGYTLV